MTERLHFHLSLSCTGEGSGSPLQCSCLENPRGGGAWWAAVCGVAQGRTRLTRLSSSSSSSRVTAHTHVALGPVSLREALKIRVSGSEDLQPRNKHPITECLTEP